MPNQSFRGLLQAVLDEGQPKKFSGAIKDAALLLQPESVAALDRRFGGAYAIFIHDPAIDSAIGSYLAGRGPATDSGQFIMVLYEPEPQLRNGPSHEGVSGVSSLTRESPLLEFLRNLFPNEHLELPGIILLRRLGEPQAPIYVPLMQEKDVGSLNSTIRKLFGHAAEALHEGGPDGYATSLGRALALSGIAYQKSDSKTVGEHFFAALRLLWDYRKDLIAVVRFAAKTAGRATGVS